MLAHTFSKFYICFILKKKKFIFFERQIHRHKRENKDSNQSTQRNTAQIATYQKVALHATGCLIIGSDTLYHLQATWLFNNLIIQVGVGETNVALNYGLE